MRPNLFNNVLFNIALFAVLVFASYVLTLYLDGAGAPPVAAAPAQETAQPASGQPAPDFSFKTIDGKSHRLNDFKGKIVLLNFWASWCAPCVKEFPTLAKIAAKNPDKLALIAISSDMEEGAIHKFLLRHKPPATKNMLVARDADQSITQNLFQTFRLPETYLIDPAGHIREKLIGGDWNPQDLERLIGTL